MRLVLLLRKSTRLFTDSRSCFQLATFMSLPTDVVHLDTPLSSIESISQSPFFYLLRLCKSVASLRNIHALLVINGVSGEPLLKTKLLGLYGLFGHVKSARLLFDQILEPDYICCKMMMRWYFMHDLYDDIIEFYKLMRRRFLVFDNVVFSIVLKACSELMNLHDVRMLHGYIIQVGSLDGFVLTLLVDMYAKCGQIDIAYKVFDRVWDRNVVCWTSMIAGYIQNGCAEEALLLFNRMRNHLVKVNNYTLGSVVTACTKLGALHQGKWVHGGLIKNGIKLNSFLVTSLLDMYVKCGVITDARLIFDEFSVIDLVLWTAMIVGYTQSGYAEEALLLFMNKKWEDVSPNPFTFASVLSACGQLRNYKLGALVHSLGIKLGLNDHNVVNALVDMYVKCGGMKDAVYLFESEGDKNVIFWNSIISGYSKSISAYEALRLFNQMRSNNVQPDHMTVIAVLSVCASFQDIRFGFSVHAYSIRKGFLASNSVYFGTAFLNLYAKCGDVKAARLFFNEMAEKDAVPWSAVMTGNGKLVNSNKCLEFFSDITKDLEPTGIIFKTMLSACRHTGLVRDGWKCFDSICQAYKFTPSMKHYVYMVDLLVHSGKLEEALEFIYKMPIHPHTSVFGAFLHGCSIHSRFDLGDVAVRNMLKKHPGDAPHYVLMSKLNASTDECHEVSKLRNSMRKTSLSESLRSNRVDLNINETCSLGVASFG